MTAAGGAGQSVAQPARQTCEDRWPVTRGAPPTPAISSRCLDPVPALACLPSAQQQQHLHRTPSWEQQNQNAQSASQAHLIYTPRVTCDHRRAPMWEALVQKLQGSFSAEAATIESLASSSVGMETPALALKKWSAPATHHCKGDSLSLAQCGLSINSQHVAS